MALVQIERGDIIATKAGESLRVVSVYYNGNDLSRVDALNDSDPSPMRRPVFSNQIARVLKKAEKDPIKSAEDKGGK